MKTSHRNNFITEALKQGVQIILIAVALSLLVNHFRQNGVPLVRDRSSEAALSSSKTAGEPLISIEEARALFLTKGAVFIDARPAELYRSGHIKGALNLPADSLDRSLPRVMAQIPPDSLIVTYCDGDNCPLSQEVALQLAARGYSHVEVLINGWTLWRDAGLPTEKSP